MTKKHTVNLTDGRWISGNTLSGNKFYWWLDDVDTLHLFRQIKPKNTWDKFTADQIDEINYFVSKADGELTLDNSVSESKKSGLGHYMQISFRLSNTQKQLASHIAALFIEAGIWQWNGLRRNIKFKSNNIDWRSHLRSQYKQKLKSIVT